MSTANEPPPVPGWSSLPDAPPARVSPFSPARTGRVVGVGAYCDLAAYGVGDRRSQSFDVSEFVTFRSGDRMSLHDERGFTLGWGSSTDLDLREGLGVEEIIQTVLSTVLPDDDDSADDHPWTWLTELARERGLDVTESELRALPYEVVLSDQLLAWLRADPNPGLG